MTTPTMTPILSSEWGQFLRYPHLERYGNTEVEGIEHGTTYVFPKLDGTNGSVWTDGVTVHAGSRNRVLQPDDRDNAGFCAYIQSEHGAPIRRFLQECPHLRLYGEWLVPHTLKCYREDAWRRFWVFDVFDNRTGRFLDYQSYMNMLSEAGVDFIPCYTIVKNGTVEHFQKAAKDCRFLLHEEAKHGEGVVIKNYDWFNRFGRVTWAKVVLDEFKEKNVVAFGPNIVGGETVEQKLAADTVTKTLVQKEYQKIFVANEAVWSSRDIPRLLETVYRCVVTEELYDWLKKAKNPDPINFKTLKAQVNIRVKQTMPELF